MCVVLSGMQKKKNNYCNLPITMKDTLKLQAI